MIFLGVVSYSPIFTLSFSFLFLICVFFKKIKGKLQKKTIKLPTVFKVVPLTCSTMTPQIIKNNITDTLKYFLDSYFIHDLFYCCLNKAMGRIICCSSNMSNLPKLLSWKNNSYISHQLPVSIPIWVICPLQR